MGVVHPPSPTLRAVDSLAALLEAQPATATSSPIQPSLDGAPPAVRRFAESLVSRRPFVDLGEFTLTRPSTLHDSTESIQMGLDLLDEDPLYPPGFDPARTIVLAADGGGMSELALAWTDDDAYFVIVEIEDPTEDTLVVEYTFSALVDWLREREQDAYDPPGLADWLEASGLDTPRRPPARVEVRRWPVADDAPLRVPARGCELLFVPGSDGRERVLVVAPGADDGRELDLPSPQRYRDLAALSPDGSQLVVGSPVYTRVVRLPSGDTRDLLQGPQQVQAIWLDEHRVGVLCRGGDHELNLRDPDVAALPSVRQLPTHLQTATMRTPGNLHVLDTRSGALEFSVAVEAEQVQPVPGGKAIALTRNPPRPDQWGTVFLRVDDGDLTSVLKLPEHVGRIGDDFRLDALDTAIAQARPARHRTLRDDLELEAQPPPPPESFTLARTAVRFTLASAPPSPKAPATLAQRYPWIDPIVGAQGWALAGLERGSAYALSLVHLEREETRAVDPPLVVERVERAWSSAGDRVLVWSDDRVYEIDLEGRRRPVGGEVFAGPVTAAAPLADGGVAVLYRCAGVDAQLDLYAADDRLLGCADVHGHDALWSLAEGRVLVTAHLRPPPGSKVRVFHVCDDGLRALGGPTTLSIARAWSEADASFVSRPNKTVYRLDHGELSSPDAEAPTIQTTDTRAGATMHLDHGYIDEAGQWVVEPRWKGGLAWADGVGRVRGPGLRMGLVDPRGRLFVPPAFASIGPFVDGVAVARTKLGRGGLLTRAGRWRVAPTFDQIGDIAQGRVRARVGDRWRLLDLEGRTVADGFERLEDFADGVAFAKPSQGQAGLIDADGNWIARGEFTGGAPCREGWVPVELPNGRATFVDTSGRVCGEAFDRVFSHHRCGAGALAAVCRRGLWAYLDHRGELITEFVFERAFNANEHFASAQLPEKRPVFVSSAGRVFGADAAWRSTLAAETLGWVQVGDAFGAIDPDGEWVIEPSFEGVGTHRGPFTPVARDGRWGLFHATRGLVLEPKHERISAPSEGKVAFQRDGLWGYLNLDGTLAIEPRFVKAEPFSEGHALARARR